jgi:hypothetical protein
MFYKIFVFLALVFVTMADNMFDPKVVQPIDEKEMVAGEL